MTRTLTTIPAPVAPSLGGRRFALLVAAIIALTLGLVIWTTTQQRPVDDVVGARQAPIQQSVRQVEHADEAAAALRQLDETDALRFRNRIDALAPAAVAVPGSQDDAPPWAYRRPAVQP